jgi:aryl-alcohol dehydrogenase-like predicted oxidoreductase
VIVYSPMASGLLTGAFTAARAAGLELKDGDLSDIAAAIRATGAGSGPASR